eukprot:CAMPEP_0185813228 /NCGR_PEP_ID=MMETSP1322-20130828/11058_1 /TAXON_ID=265543 /ORGANISM="Minutocellus polymorphus, Strain RCC2270" /LENGTH=143 /DNA_ID=CAMNT_0028509867 /DNA_START=370 /DNA_END=801 /DNA_ORIENTATION=-
MIHVSVVLAECTVQYKPPAHVPTGAHVGVFPFPTKGNAKWALASFFTGSPFDILGSAMTEQPLAGLQLSTPRCHPHGEMDRNIFVAGIGSIVIKPPHHREVAFHGEVAHGFDCVGGRRTFVAVSGALNIPNVVRVESNILKPS